MPVFFKNDLFVLYVHVPKTGGRFVSDLFLGNGFSARLIDTSHIVTGFNRVRTCSPQHYHAALLREVLRIKKFAYVFMTVRDPVARLKSEFLWRVRDPGVDPNAWAKHVLHAYGNDPFILDNHIRPQSQFILDAARVFRIEDGLGENWLAELNAQSGLGLKMLLNKPANSSADFAGRSSSTVDFTPRTASSIRQFYAEDFASFGYDRPC